jgi:hypothetical protein
VFPKKLTRIELIIREKKRQRKKSWERREVKYKGKMRIRLQKIYLRPSNS